MSTKHGQNLTADLLHDLTVEQAGAPVAVRPSQTPVEAGDAGPSAVLETSLFLAPSTWLRPRIERAGATLSLSAGPLRVRVGKL